VATVDPSNPFIQPAPTPSDAERGLTEGVDPEQLGGDPSDPPEVVTDLPPLPAGATIDPATIADPGVSGGGTQFIIDTNASEPGIQTSRTVRVGDVFRVGVVLANINDLATFNFMLNYDITKAIAPTINGGSSLGRNPDINESGLGGEAAQWSCSPPAPEGDADEPGLMTGDGDPATGQAFISCFTPAITRQNGTFVLATVQFQAVATGTFQLSLDDTQAFDSSFSESAGCPGVTVVPCQTASITVESR
jgi:hypothetical protein